MKWIEISKARKLVINEAVFVKLAPLAFATGRLIEQKKTAKGVEHTFEIATFEGKCYEATDVTHVAIPTA